MSGPALGRAVRSGMAWSILESWGVQLLQFLTFLVIARYVDATMLGIVAMALLVGQWFQMIILSGISASLVSKGGAADADLDDTAFWISAAAGALLLIATFLLADWVERTAAHQGLGMVLRWLSVANFLGALNVVPQAWLTRALLMRPLATRSTISTLVGGLVGIALAVAGYGVMALVAQNLAVAVIGTIILWAACPMRPRLRFSREKARDVLFYGRHVGVTGAANFFNANADIMVIGLALGGAATGIYTVGKRALLAANLMLARALSRVALPVFSQLKGDPPRLAKAFLKIVSATSSITTPAFVGLAIVSDEFIFLLFGPRWAAAADVMHYLSLFGALQAIGIYNQSLMLAMGKPQWQTWLAGIYALVNIVTFFFAVEYGMAAVAAAFTARAYILYPLSVWPVVVLLPLGWRDYWKALGPSVVASVVMAVFLWGFRFALAGQAPIPMLLSTVIAGAAVYMVVLGLVGRTIVIDMFHFARAGGKRVSSTS